MDNKRGTWNSRLMFLLAAIGSAVGLGNLWGFPYRLGANGGLPFLLIYIALVVFAGVICMTVEMVIGRKTGLSPVEAMTTFGKKYRIVGWFGTLSAFIIMGFYTVILSYGVRYFAGYVQNIFGGDGFGGAETGADTFVNYSTNIPEVLIYTLIAFAICALFVSLGTAGLEKFNKVGIPALFVILVIITIYNFTLPGFAEGYKFMFTTYGLTFTDGFDFFAAVRSAGGQMLFSLSLGMGAMITYGSYLDKKESIAVNTWIIPLFDTLAAILAGMCIMPAVFATGQNPRAGVGLLFMTMFNVFETMGRVGNIIGALFYLLVIFAGVSSCISLMEVVASSIIDIRAKKEKKSNRKAVTLLVTVAMFIISIPVCLDQMGLNGDQGFFWPLYQHFDASAQDLVDVYDVITEGLMMPLAAIFMCIGISRTKGFGWMKEEVLADGKPWKMEKFFEICVKYITPVLMTFVLVSLFLSYFGI